jgi:hypothetical protein
MIKNITSNGTYIQVHHGYHNIPPMSPGAQSAGLLRYNGNNQCVEVYNGMAWYPIDDTNIILGRAKNARRTKIERSYGTTSRIKRFA